MARHRFLRHRLAVGSALFLLLIAFLSLAAPMFEAARGLDGNQVNLFARFQLPSADAWLGRDELGRDVFQRLLQGGQVSLLVGLVTAFCAALIGTIIGLIAGYHGGWLDAFLMRCTDSVIALPLLPLLIVMSALDLNKLGLPAVITESREYQSISYNLHRGAGRLDNSSATGPRRNPQSPGAGFRHRRSISRCQCLPHHESAHTAQPDVPYHRRNHFVGRKHHSFGVSFELPGARHSATSP